MADSTECIVDGFAFSSDTDAELAKNELKKIKYLDEHVDLSNIHSVKSLYEKAIDERYFQTPVGLEYLRKLRRVLLDSGAFDNGITPIPLYMAYRHNTISEEPVMKKRTSKAKKQELELKQKYRTACFLATFFGILIVIMIFITLNGTTPNAMNYKTAVLNQYSDWEQELTERENAVKAKERELGINY